MRDSGLIRQAELNLREGILIAAIAKSGYAPKMLTPRVVRDVTDKIAVNYKAYSIMARVIADEIVPDIIQEVANYRITSLAILEYEERLYRGTYY